MELAMEEMNKSRNEPRPDGKTPPKVGAVILFPDGKIERAHRGELRDGDHAEYTLLERKLGNMKLDDCVLFTTLEPCMERNHPKISCARRTEIARIKLVYVGMTDPDPSVYGKGIKHLMDNEVRVKMFDRDIQLEIERVNSKFIEEAADRRTKAEKEELKTTLEKSEPTFNLGLLSDIALQKFIKESKIQCDINSNEFYEYLANKGILEFDNQENIYKPTGLGIILFGKNPRDKFRGAVLKAHVDYGADKVEPKDFDQALVLIPDLVEEWLLKVLPLSKDTSSFKRKDIPEFPIPVLREAVINAIVHRDYLVDDGLKSFLEIDNEKIIVKNPGSPHPAITLDQLNTFKAPSISRNPIISYIFSLMDYVEEKGFGMKTWRSLNEKYDLPLPEYTFNDPFLSLTFARNLESIKNVSIHPNLARLSLEELKGYEYLKSKGELSKREYASYFQINYKKAQRHLTKMKDLNLIGDNGEKPKSPKFKYVIK